MSARPEDFRPARLGELLEDYLEGRLTAEDHAELERHLVTSPAACRQFWDHVRQHAQLAEILAEAAGGREMAVAELLPVREEVTPGEPPPRRRGLLSVAGLALAAGLLLTGGVGWFLTRPTAPPRPEVLPAGPTVARLAEAQGEVFVQAGDSLRRAGPGTELHPGEELRTRGGDSFAVLAFTGGGEREGRIELSPETAVRLTSAVGSAEGAVQGSTVFLVEGAITGDVPQEAGSRPMMLATAHAEVRMPGTRFTSATAPGGTRLEVEEGRQDQGAGRALFTRKSDGKTIPVAPGSYAVATPAPGGAFEPARLPARISRPRLRLEEASGPALALALSPDGQSVAAGGWLGPFKVWDLTTGAELASPPTSLKRTRALLWAADGREILAGGESRVKRGPALVAHDPATWAESSPLTLSREVKSLSRSADGLLAALVGEVPGRDVQVWTAPGYASVPLADSPGVSARSVALSANPAGAARLAVGYVDGTVRLYDPATRRLARALGEPGAGPSLAEGGGEVGACAFSPDGSLLAAGTRDGTVRLWRADTGDLVWTTSAVGEIRCLTFSPDGRRLAGGQNGLARLWDVATGRERLTYLAHKFATTAVAFTPNGRTLVTAGWDRAAKVWDVPALD